MALKECVYIQKLVGMLFIYNLAVGRNEIYELVEMTRKWKPQKTFLTLAATSIKTEIKMKTWRPQGRSSCREIVWHRLV